MTGCSPGCRSSVKSLLFALFVIVLLCFWLNVHQFSDYQAKSNLKPIHSLRLSKNYSLTNYNRLSKEDESQTKKTPNERVKGILKLRCTCEEVSPRPYQTVSSAEDSSVCSPFATARGPGQKVVAYSLYRTQTSMELRRKFLKPLFRRAETILAKLPGWVMRVYTSTQETTGRRTDHSLCQLHCRYPHVDICDVRNLPVLGDYGETLMTGRVWRFIPLVDPLVDVFLSRDADSFILDRELDCVKEWLSSSYMFHTLHDHPYHGIDILGGLWGAKLNVNRSLADVIGSKILFDKPRSEYYYDMQLLKRHIRRKHRIDMLCHASYECISMGCGEVRPFPSQRIGTNYTGCGENKDSLAQAILKTKCPSECRPEKHKDWEYC